MINLIYTPQRADFKAVYIVNDDVLKVKIKNIEETFDFTAYGEGIAAKITAEKLPINPILSAERIGTVLNIKVIRFYTAAEKEEYENGDN